MFQRVFINLKKRNQGYDIHLKHICKNKRLCLLTTVFGIKENLFLKKDYLHSKIRQNNFVKVRKSSNIPHCFVCLYIFIIVRGGQCLLRLFVTLVHEFISQQTYTQPFV